jgi:O-succinylbenzoic acid--CoA ligase
MHELSVIAAAREAPCRDFLVTEDVAHSFEDVAARADAAITNLRALGVAPGVRVALTPRADLETVVWLCALFELGAPAVLLHPRLTPVERDALVGAADVHCVLDEPPPSSAQGPGPDSSTVPDDRPLAVVYTSGTSGSPLGAVLSRRAFVASARAHAANLPWRDDDRWLLAMPPAHIGGLSILTRSLIARTSVVLAPGPFDVGSLPSLMAKTRVTLLSLVPTMLRRLVEGAPPWQPHPELRAVLVGGAAFPDALRAKAVELGIPVLGTYGCTEACSQIATQRGGQGAASGSGSPLPGIDVRIRGDEIQVRGEVLMDGYLGGDRSSATWTDDDWFRTGDVGTIDPIDGQIHVLGRRDDMIITGGENVAPGEVEAVLESLSGVRQACVFGVPDEEWGEQVAAALVVDPDVYRPAALALHLETRLAGHKRPKHIAVVETLPTNRAGKLDRRATARSAADHLRPI